MSSKFLGYAATAGDLKKILLKVPDYIPLQCDDCAEISIVAVCDSLDSLKVQIVPFDRDVDAFEIQEESFGD